MVIIGHFRVQNSLKHRNNSLQKLVGTYYNSDSEMFVYLNMLSFNELLKKYIYSFRWRLIDPTNT